MKKFLTIFVALIATLSLWAGNIITYTAAEKLTVTTDTYSSGLHPNAFNVSITSHTFSNGTGTITFAGEVTSIGDDAFYECSGLTSITIPNTITSIGRWAFGGCSGLTSITIPNTVTSIGGSAFEGCSSLTSITIPDGVTSIGGSAFRGCSGLTSITIPNSVTSIGGSAFEGCSGLTSITIPNSVTSIGDRAFWGCSGLTSITIPNSVTSIGDYTFYDCSGLTSVTIGNSVTSIGGGAFYKCSGLTSVTIPNSVTSIGRSAFSGCSGLTSITIPNSVTSIEGYAFSGCSSLTSIVWNAKYCSILSDYEYAPFYEISSQITDFALGEEVESVPNYLCYGMNNLTSITIPNSVTSIGESAFRGCSGLTSIVWNAKNCSSPSGSSVAPFNGISSQFTDFTLGEEVESVPNYLCSGMNKLTSITIPNSVTSIGEYAFKGCSAMRKVVMGSAIASIGNEAFSGCTGLIELQVNAVVPPLIDATTFNDVSRTLPVYVPGGSIDSYRAAQYWNEFNNLKAQTLPQATLTLNADSEMGAAYGAGTYDKGSDVQIFAIDNSGYEFTGWSDGNTDNPRTLRLTDNLTLTANFEKIEVAEYTINVSAINPALGTATASELVLVEAVPYPGCTFVCWSDGNFENPRYIPLTGDINLQAIFSGTPTSVAETTDKAQGVVRKVIVDGQLRIIRDDKTYTVEGSVVK